MPNASGALFPPLEVLFFTSAMFSCASTVAALSPPRDAGEFWRESDTRNSLGTSVAGCAADIIRAHRVGPPMVAVVFADGATWLPHLLAALQRPPEMPVLLLAFGKKARRNTSPTNQPPIPRNMSHAVYLPSYTASFDRLFEKAMSDFHWSPTTMHLVVASTTQGMDSDGGAEVLSALKLAWRQGVANIAVVVPAVDGQLDARVSVVTHFPYSSGEICGRESTRIEEVAEWRDGRFTRGDPHRVFRFDKFRDLNGCVVRVTVYDNPPACIPKGKGLHKDEVEQLGGIQGFLLTEVAKRMNFTPQITQLHPENYGTSSNPFWQILSPLLEHHTDMVMCEVVLTLDRVQTLGEGFHHLWTCITFAVPISHPSSSWRLLGLASPPAWIALLISIVLSCTASWIIYKLQPHQHHMPHYASSAIVTDTLVAFVGVPIERPPISSSSRALFPAVSLAGLIMATAIQAHLSSFHSAPALSWAPSNLEEMAASRLGVRGSMAIKFLAKDMESKVWKTILQRYELHNEGIEALNIDGVAVAGMKRNLLYQLFQLRLGKVVLNECPLPLPTAIFLRKGSPFQEELKKIEQGLASGGFITKWVKDVTSKMISSRAMSKSVEKRKIYLSEMNGVFILYSLGLLASFVSFVSEVAVVKCTHNK